MNESVGLSRSERRVVVAVAVFAIERGRDPTTEELERLVGSGKTEGPIGRLRQRGFLSVGEPRHHGGSGCVRVTKLAVRLALGTTLTATPAEALADPRVWRPASGRAVEAWPLYEGRQGPRNPAESRQESGNTRDVLAPKFG